jgi:hypothetical protein
MTSRHLRLPLVVCVILIFFTTSGFGQGSKRKSEYDPIEEGGQDRPDKRAEWMRRGRVDANLPNAWLNLTHVYGICSSKAHVHPDEHGIDFALVNGKAMLYFANDGGIYRALDGYSGLNVGSCNTAGNNQFDNLNETIGSMTQLVSFSIHPTDQDTVLGGTQDNGSPASNAATSNPQWITVNGGDGGYNAINPANPLQWFTANTDVSIRSCNGGSSVATRIPSCRL